MRTFASKVRVTTRATSQNRNVKIAECGVAFQVQKERCGPLFKSVVFFREDFNHPAAAAWQLVSSSLFLSHNGNRGPVWTTARMLDNCGDASRLLVQGNTRDDFIFCVLLLFFLLGLVGKNVVGVGGLVDIVAQVKHCLDGCLAARMRQIGHRGRWAGWQTVGDGKRAGT